MNVIKELKRYFKPLTAEEEGKQMRPFIKACNKLTMDELALALLEKNQDTVYCRD